MYNKNKHRQHPKNLDCVIAI